MIAVLDYGVGNVKAFLNLYRRIGMEALPARSVDVINAASHIILPGVGAFDTAMSLLNRSGLREALEQNVRVRNKPLLGVCVGMQMLAESSAEGQEAGLGWISGQVNKIEVPACLPLPHMGWNDIHIKYQHPILAGLEDSPRFYFLHSYQMTCLKSESVLATAEYGETNTVSAVVAHNNVFGMQCHPEKSHEYGIQFLKNFGELECSDLV